MALLTSPRPGAGASLAGIPLSPPTPLEPRQLAWMAGVLGLALLWSFWTTLQNLADRWGHDPQYSHGYLVPLFALVLLWKRRDQVHLNAWSPSWWGLPVLAGALGLRLLAVTMDVDAVDAFTILPTLAGLVLLIGGRAALAWSWPGIAFLGFMLPLPFFLEQSLSQPLRGVATRVSTYVLQTCGHPAVAEGNIIAIGPIQLMVAEACSGLGMLMTFFALSTAVALVLQAPLLDRLILVASAIPIAVLANVVRITATGIVSATWGVEVGRALFHDLAGWLMMPLALLLMWLELRFLRRLLPEAQPGPAAATSWTVPGLIPLSPGQAANLPVMDSRALGFEPQSPVEKRT